ncbi:hypothetical protein GVAV_001425 [Gurleya vavrai]
MIMIIQQNLDLSLITQAVPSLLISLIGLSLSGRKLDLEQNTLIATIFPLLLISNCILSFKGNAEIIYAMNLSSLSQVKSLCKKKYLRFSFDNGCLVLAQSIVIGFSVGILGMARNIISNVGNLKFFPYMIASCIVASFISSLFLILLLVPSMLISVMLNTNPDNIILPVISSIGDYMDIYALVFCMQKFHKANLLYCLSAILIILLTLPVFIYASLKSKHRIPIQNFYVLISTYILSTISSYAIQHFAKKHLILASSYPLFCGLTGSCSYIYLNRKITSMQNSTPHNQQKIFYTLVLVSSLVSILTTILMPIFGLKIKLLFGFLFIISFISSVCLLMKVIDKLVKYYIDDVDEITVVALPSITSCADFLGTFFIIGICFIVDGV